MSDNPFDDPEVTKRRSNFLTVLCVLSFIVTGYSIVNGLTDLFTSSDAMKQEMQTSIDQLETRFQNMGDEEQELVSNIMDSMVPFMNKTIANRIPLAITVILLQLLAFYGIVKMFQVRRKGFRYYATGKLLLILVPFVYLGFNVITIFWVIAAVVVTLVMIALYGSQRKHMA